jgi:hypothetical protein
VKWTDVSREVILGSFRSLCQTAPSINNVGQVPEKIKEYGIRTPEFTVYTDFD